MRAIQRDVGEIGFSSSPVPHQNSIALPHLHLQIREPSLDPMLNLFFSTIFSSLRSRQSLVLENIALRHQLDVFQRNAKRPRLKPSDRVFWALFSRFQPDWRRHLIIVQPKTVVGWHRNGWRLYWKWKSRSKRQGRPAVSVETRNLIRKFSHENPLWGAPRIHGELAKLGIEVGETTVARYMIKFSKPPPQTWRTFIRNHMAEIVAIDFFTVPTLTFRTLYVFVILSLDRRRIVHFNVTSSPTAEWTSLQLLHAFPFDTAPRFLIRDRDGIYGKKVVVTLKAMDIQQIVTSRISPWQNGFCERVIGSIRRKCLDHIIVFNARHLRKILRQYFDYYHESRTHRGLMKDSPVSREVQGPQIGEIRSEPVLGGLHHRYFREAA